LFSVARSSEAAVVGLVVIEPVGGTHSEHNATGHTEVSYQLLPEHWGGYGREAVSAATGWALQNINPAPPVVIAVTQEANKKSRHLLEPIGMTPVDRFVEWDEPQLMYSVDRATLRSDLPRGD
jgi:RimJ/RimL family protein N-acetyltransferase